VHVYWERGLRVSFLEYGTSLPLLRPQKGNDTSLPLLRQPKNFNGYILSVTRDERVLTDGEGREKVRGKMKESRRWGKSRDRGEYRRREGERGKKRRIYIVRQCRGWAGGLVTDRAAALTVMSLLYMVWEISTQNLNQRLTASLIF
jgi:hypothetical protein